MGLSVIVCCYNSSKFITACLEHIACQNLDGITLEVILVDNNCTDDTVNIALQAWRTCGSPFILRIIEEKVSGIAYARKKGVLEAKGEIL